MLQLIRLTYLGLSIAVIAAILFRIGVRYTFNGNEGWNAFWATVAWDGSELYPGPGSYKLNNYLPFWSYVIGGLGRITGDNIQAGRILAGLAMLMNALAISLIVREITGQKQGSWFAGAAFLAICGLFYGDYVAANDPQLAANLLMTIALWRFVRTIDRGGNGGRLVVALLLLGGLIKHNVIAVPISMAVFLLLYRRPLLPAFIVRAAIGLIAICAALYIAYGPSLFSAVLFPRQYDLGVAWAQTKDHLASYNVLLLIIPYLAFHPGSPARLIFIYAAVSLVLGSALSGAFDVDINVFLDLAIAVAIGLGLLLNRVRALIANQFAGPKANLSVAALAAITLIPVVFAVPSGVVDARRLFDAMTSPGQQVDLGVLRAARGHVACQNLSLCYWAGKEFEMDFNNLRILMSARPELETKFIEHIKGCYFSLIQLAGSWDDEDEGPFTPKIIEALEQYYSESEETDSSLFMRPACDKADATHALSGRG